MSLFEMRLFQDNLSTRWKGGMFILTGLKEIPRGLQKSLFCDSQQHFSELLEWREHTNSTLTWF